MSTAGQGNGWGDERPGRDEASDVRPESAADPASPVARAGALRRGVGHAAERIEEILNAAEALAIEIRSSAEAEAEEYLAQRKREADALVVAESTRLRKLRGLIADELSDLRRRAVAVAEELDAAVEEVERRPDEDAGTTAGGVSQAAEGPRAVREPDRVHPDPVPAPAGPRPVGGGPTGGDPAEAPHAHEQAILRATQMAVAGTDREQIVATIADEFRLDDAASIADQILGPR